MCQSNVSVFQWNGKSTPRGGSTFSIIYQMLKKEKAHFSKPSSPRSLLKLQTVHSSLLLLPIGPYTVTRRGGQDERDQHIAVSCRAVRRCCLLGVCRVGDHTKVLQETWIQKIFFLENLNMLFPFFWFICLISHSSSVILDVTC